MWSHNFTMQFLLRRKEMKNEISQEYLANVGEKPEMLDCMNCGTSKYIILAQTIKALASTKCLVFSEQEFFSRFGKSGKSNIKISCKKYGIIAKVAKIGDRFYVSGKGLTNGH